MIWWIRITISGVTSSNLIGIVTTKQCARSTGGRIDRVERDPRAGLGAFGLDAESFERPGVLRDVGQSASGAFPTVEFLDGGFEIGNGEVGPAFWQENKLCKGALPQKEVRKALFAAGANEQIDFSGAATYVSQNFAENAAEGFLGELGDFVEPARSLINGLARGIVDREAQMQALAVSGSGFGVGDGLTERAGQTIATADDAEAYAFLDAVGGLD